MTKEKEFGVGVVVTLRSGGPLMTVVAISYENDTRVCCGFFDANNTYSTVWFNTEALEKGEKKC